MQILRFGILAAFVSVVALIGVEPRLASDTSSVASHADDEDSDELERNVTLEEIPAAARQAILAEAGGRELNELEEVTAQGVVTYDAEWITGGTEIEIEVSSDGTVLDRETEDLDAEPDDD